jgi:hypothetical protein
MAGRADVWAISGVARTRRGDANAHEQAKQRNFFMGSHCRSGEMGSSIGCRVAIAAEDAMRGQGDARLCAGHADFSCSQIGSVVKSMGENYRPQHSDEIC